MGLAIQLQEKRGKGIKVVYVDDPRDALIAEINSHDLPFTAKKWEQTDGEDLESKGAG